MKVLCTILTIFALLSMMAPFSLEGAERMVVGEMFTNDS